LPISRIRETGLVQLDRVALSRGKVTVPDQAILEVLHVHNGEHVYEGKLLAELRSTKLEAELAEAQSLRDGFRAEEQAAARTVTRLSDPDEKKQAESDRVLARDRADEQESRIRTIQTQIRALRELRAPCNGVVMEAPRREEVGKLWEKEQPQPFCIIGDASKLLVIVPVTADDFHLLQRDLAESAGLPVTVRVPGRRTDYASGMVNRLPETDAKDVPVQLTHRCGGPLAVKPGNDPRVNQPQNQQYLIEVDLDNADPNLLPGTLVQAKIHCQWRTCAWWCWRKISSLFDLGLI
jgi:putative peptide zinc metalloprotease protein